MTDMIVFFDDFTSWNAAKWTKTESSAYAYETFNPGDAKLDRIDPDNVQLHKGTAHFFAKADGLTMAPYSANKSWTTGLLTTEYSAEGFQAIPGDLIELRCKLYQDTGAWPALWTWVSDAVGMPANGEVDIFEYHADNPRLLEVSNHLGVGAYAYVDEVVTPGEWVKIGCRINSDDCTWYVNDVPIYSDGQGVPANWHAYLILNLSVSAGEWHPEPVVGTMLRFNVDWVKVSRPTA